jgi:hypothetical protein
MLRAAKVALTAIKLIKTLKTSPIGIISAFFAASTITAVFGKQSLLRGLPPIISGGFPAIYGIIKS